MQSVCCCNVLNIKNIFNFLRAGGNGTDAVRIMESNEK
jgi:hypothetical protein